MFWGIDVGNGIVEYDDISFLPEDFSAANYVDLLKEDMLQICYPDDILIDVSWRPSMRVNGRFFIVTVKDSDWDRPIIARTALDVQGVKCALREMIAAIK